MKIIFDTDKYKIENKQTNYFKLYKYGSALSDMRGMGYINIMFYLLKSAKTCKDVSSPCIQL